MPRYFFHTEHHNFCADREGVDLPDVASAHAEAVRLTGELLLDPQRELWTTRRWRMLVAPESGPALFGIEINPVAGPDLIPWGRS